MTDFDTWNTSCDQKKGWESNWQLDSQPLKVKNHPYFLVCRWRATHYWKVLDNSYNIVLNFISIEGLHTKLWAPKIVRIPTVGISKLPGQNDIWVLVLRLGTKYTIRGKVVASPKFESWWVLWIYVCPWLVYASKCCNYALTNLLFSLCRSVWVSEVLVKLLNPILELQHAPLPPKCCKLRSAPQLVLLSMFLPLNSQLSPLRNLGCVNICLSLFWIFLNIFL